MKRHVYSILAINDKTRKKRKNPESPNHMYIQSSRLLLMLSLSLSCSVQSHEQPDIDHKTLSGKYPRYPSVFDVTVSEDEKRKLMVCVCVCVCV